MLTLSEMLNKLKKQLDPEIENIINKLMKKGLDANSFIAKEVKECLASICANSSDNKVVNCLFSHAN